MDKNSKIVITGAAGLLGQNLITELLSQGYTNLTAIDKDEHNLEYRWKTIDGEYVAQSSVMGCYLRLCIKGAGRNCYGQGSRDTQHTLRRKAS